MPGGDKTGPAGMGPMTGRAAGYCAGYGAPGYANAGWGRGFGMGFGRGRGGGFGGGRGWRHRFYATGVPGWARPGVPYGPAHAAAPTEEQELEMLNRRAEYFGDALADVKKRIEELQAEKADK
ncbi:MAG: DUF5320 domain-containing protein [Kiritimatiellae bacterium]|nr:DUF5320 domain-containing protein [Kiritimatiellia bacterium]